MRAFLILILFFPGFLFSQENTNQNKFRQLYQELPTPNSYRTASGAPGHEYWQQQADCNILVTLNDQDQTIHGVVQITYHNNSPDDLTYLWLQLDQNRKAKNSDSYLINQSKISDKITMGGLTGMKPWFDGGYRILHVKDQYGKELDHMVIKTMLRIDLPTSLKSGESFQFEIKYWFPINNRLKVRGRSGYEYFEEDDNYLYTIAQFFPRMCVYNDVEGWQNKQFLGAGEFALSFGNYDVKIKVPEDHFVAATGVLQNPENVLSDEQLRRFAKAKKSYDETVMIVTEAEAIENEKNKSKKLKTWHFKAENVRDFAFASSRKFIWDAMAVKLPGGGESMAMSMYPKEGNPLWEKYSTKVIAHTLHWFSHYTFDYPYPVAWSIHTDKIGMEYPMISFNGARPEKDGTYSKQTKYGLISVIIHEIGHFFFPMIVNSDERQWAWMDEGLTTLVQYLTEQQWERNYPSGRGPAYKIVEYMSGDKNKIAPIMTNSESIWQLGNNAYGKPAAALNILRETIMGREIFDYAFKEYSQRWMFKHPTPADFFRTMEDASGIDLDWFWRGWFYTNDHVDQAITNVRWYQSDSGTPMGKKQLSQENRKEEEKYIGNIRNKEIEQTQDEKDPSLRDFYTDYDPLKITSEDEKETQAFLESLDPKEREHYDKYKHYYEVSIKNNGGLVMPIILKFKYIDGTNEVIRIPAEVWRKEHVEITKTFPTEKEVASIELDPFLEIADTDRTNNHFPERKVPTRFEIFKNKASKTAPNPIQKSKMGSERS